MELQTIDGQPLSHEEFKDYILEVMKMAASNKDFNYPQFLYDLRNKCGITLEELMGYIHEITIERIENEGLTIS